MCFFESLRSGVKALVTEVINKTEHEETELAGKDYLLSLAQDLGYVTLDDVLAAYPEAENNLDQLGRNLTRVGRNIASDALPALVAFSNELVRFSRSLVHG